MERYVSYAIRPKQPDLIDAELVALGFVERRRNARYHGHFHDEFKTRSPFQLLKCIAHARETSSTILLPYAANVLSRKKFRLPLSQAQLEVRSLDGLFTSLAEFEKILPVYEQQSQQRKQQGIRAISARHELGRRGNPMLPQLATDGSKKAAEIAALRRREVAVEIDSIFAQKGKSMSLRAIARELDARKVPTMRGGKNWRVSSLTTILQEHFPAWWTDHHRAAAKGK